MDSLDAFNQQRSAIFGVAYRMLGSVADAEDMVQEAFLRWQAEDREHIESAKAYLTTVVTRLCIDHLRSARVRREVYPGDWLPEPLPTDERGPAHAAEVAESLSTAFLVLLQSLGPGERAAFLLREVFDYDYETIADVLGKTPISCRQMVKRARERVTQRRRRFAVSPEEHERVVIKFMEASTDGDYESLVTLLSEDAELVTDHGGKALAARRMIYGPDKIARLILGLRKKGEFADFTTKLRFVNGAMSMITRRGDALHGVMTFEIEDGRIRRMFHVVNPDKLRALENPPSAN